MGRHLGRSPCAAGTRAAVAACRIRPKAVAILGRGLAMLVLLCTGSVIGKEIKGLGFYPPFQTFNARGDRMVPSFTFVGGTAAKQSFVRLTPDMKQHYGALNSRLTGRFRDAQGPPGGQFSLAMTFRISGRIEKLHGSYLAVVLGVPDTIKKNGDTYGIREDFVGVGIVISPHTPMAMNEDIYDPTRPVGPRQFVSFIANNGTRSTEQVRALANTCASTIRYYEARDDFNFLKSSRVRLGYYDGEVTLEVDARNYGVWRKCLSTKVVDMPDGWLERASVVVVAETGQVVSNNHDVMSLEVYTEQREAFDASKVDGNVEEEDPDMKSDAYRRKRMWALKAHLEHEYDAVERILKDSVEKLADINDNMSRRLTKLEKDVSTEAFARLNTRVRDIEKRVLANSGQTVEKRMNGIEEVWTGEMGSQYEDMLLTNKGHRLPFILVLGIVVALFAASVKQYRKLMRSNFLGGMR